MIKAVSLALLSLALLVLVIIGLGKSCVSVIDSIVLSKPVVLQLPPGTMQVINFNTLIIHELPFLENIQLYRDHSVKVQVNGADFLLGFSRPNTYDSLVFDVIPEHGDVVGMSYAHSTLPWWTPFDINFFIPTPTHRRNSYYTLTWQKADGQRLIARWCFQQNKYAGHDWRDWRSPVQFAGDSGLTELTVTKNANHKHTK